MNFELQTLSLSTAAAQKCDLLVVPVAEGFVPGADALSILAARALEKGDLTTKPGKHLHLYQPPAVGARRVLLLGVGKGSPSAIRQALLAVSADFKAPAVRHAVVSLADGASDTVLAAAVQAVAEASYVYTATKPKAEVPGLEKVVFGVAHEEALSPAFAQAMALVHGQNLAREWGNRPGNHATPSRLAEVAKSLAREPRIDCKVHGPEDVERLGMGAFMAVARGSKEPLRFIELHYRGADKKQAPVVLVGKGITFDSGGISLKPGAEMDEMKFDMCGAASVLGVFRALAELQPALNVVGLIPACENLPDGRALKPGDVVTSMSGQTIEVLNTDAEGRLILCDALTYAARFKPAALVDIATLTGACVIALGAVRSGLFANDETLAAQLSAAGEAALDLCWRMPLDEEYAEGLKSNFADVANVAGRPAGSVTAAKFLQRFVGEWPWAHLDIAGTAWKSGTAKGATGRPVGLLLHFLLGRAQQEAQQAPAPVKAASRSARAKSGPRI